MSVVVVPPDFLNAHDRHWQDGETLFLAQRWANADHLFGVAAECGLKAVMERVGMTVEPSGRPAKPYDVHIDRLWDLFLTFAKGHLAAGYVNLLPTINAFSNWSVHQRYTNEAHFTKPDVQGHRAACELVRSLVRRAKTDGVLP